MLRLSRTFLPLLAGLLSFGSAGCDHQVAPSLQEAFTHKTNALPPLPGEANRATYVLLGPRVVAFAAVDNTATASLFTCEIPAGASWQRTVSSVPLPSAATLHALSTRDGVIVDPSTVVAPAWVPGTASGGTEVKPLPPLPELFVPACAATHRGFLYLASHSDNRPGAPPPRLISFNLARDPRKSSWFDLGAVDSTVGNPHTMAFQSDGDRPRLYLFGAAPRGGASSARHSTVASFEIARRKWERFDAPSEDAVPTHAAAFGVAQVWVSFRPSTGPGSHLFRYFNTVTHRWTVPMTSSPGAVLLDAEAQGARILSLGRSATDQLQLTTMTYTVRARRLRTADYVVLGLFFVTLVGISWLHSRGSRSAEGYFRGGRKIPWLAAGLSVVATRLSATSFISIPAKSFATNWQYSFVPLTNIVGAFIMSRYFVKFFVRLNVTSGYEYLEKRFSPLVRTVGSLNYLLYELSRIGILILVPAIALYAVAKFDLSATILAIGLIVTVYTVVGGIEGIVWADVFQMGVKIVGLIIAIVVVFAHLPGGPFALLGDAWREGKMRVVDVSWDFSRDTLWVFILFWITDGLKSYVANQTIIQRFISTKDLKSAQRTIWSSALIGTAVSWLFLLLGTGLFLFYRQSPERFDLSMDKPDGVFPWFIVFELPAGLVGLLIAALVAAAMSSLSGALNSTSTVMVTDFYRRFARAPSDAGAVRLGKILTGSVGVFATGLALLLARLSNKSLFNQTLSVVGLFGGGLGGLFLLGMVTTRTSSAGALAGLAASAVVQFAVSQFTSLHLLTYMFTGMSSCIVVGYLASVVWPERKNLAGLTVHTYT